MHCLREYGYAGFAEARQSKLITYLPILYMHYECMHDANIVSLSCCDQLVSTVIKGLRNINHGLWTKS